LFVFKALDRCGQGLDISRPGASSEVSETRYWVIGDLWHVSRATTGWRPSSERTLA